MSDGLLGVFNLDAEIERCLSLTATSDRSISQVLSFSRSLAFFWAARLCGLGIGPVKTSPLTLDPVHWLHGCERVPHTRPNIQATSP